MKSIPLNFTALTTVLLTLPSTALALPTATPSNSLDTYPNTPTYIDLLPRNNTSPASPLYIFVTTDCSSTIRRLGPHLKIKFCGLTIAETNNDVYYLTPDICQKKCYCTCSARWQDAICPSFGPGCPAAVVQQACFDPNVVLGAKCVCKISRKRRDGEEVGGGEVEGKNGTMPDTGDGDEDGGGDVPGIYC